MPEPIPNQTPYPAPDPAATPAPAAATPPPSPTPPPSGGDDPFDAEFLAGAKEAVAASPSKAPETSPAAPKAGDKPPAKPTTPPAATKPPEGGPKELRSELERVRTERDTFKRQQAALEKRIAEAEAKGKDTAALAERAAKLEQTIAEREGELRMLKQEASPEFKDKYEKPFTEAAEYAREVVSQLTVTNPEDGTSRPATWDDFASLYSQPYSKAIEQATNLFGAGQAQVVLNHLTELHRLDSVRHRALKTEREQAAARMKDEEGKRVQSQEAAAAAMAKLHEELPQKFEAYRDPPEDKELAEARAKQFSIFDSQPKSPQQAMVKWAHIRQMVGAHKPLLIQMSRLKSEVARLQSELDGKTTKEPQPGRRPGGTETGGGEESWEQAASKELANVN